MATAKQCDICGKYYPQQRCYRKIRIIRDNHPYSDYVYDLCDECQKKLEEFIHEEELTNGGR